MSLITVQDLLNLIYDELTSSLRITSTSSLTQNKFDTTQDHTTTVGIISTQVLEANGNRKYALLVNIGNEIIFLRLGSTAQLNTGIPLNPRGGNYEITLANLYTGEITAICQSGGKFLLITEA